MPPAKGMPAASEVIGGAAVAARLVTESVSAARAGNEIAGRAKAEAIRIGWEHVGREKLAERLQEALAADVLVFGADGVRLVRYLGGTRVAAFKFHPSTAPLRIENIARGGADVCCLAMGLRGGDSVLDCTMGLGADAIVAAYATGPCGSLVALEASEEIFTAVDIGMRGYAADDRIVEALGRIARRHADYREVLRELDEGSYDVVFMDPMFKTKVSSATPIDAIRAWAFNAYPSWEDVLEAARVARRRFVMKVRKGERASLPYDMERMRVFHSSHAGPVEYIGMEKGVMIP